MLSSVFSYGCCLSVLTKGDSGGTDFWVVKTRANLTDGDWLWRVQEFVFIPVPRYLWVVLNVHVFKSSFLLIGCWLTSTCVDILQCVQNELAEQIRTCVAYIQVYFAYLLLQELNLEAYLFLWQTCAASDKSLIYPLFISAVVQYVHFFMSEQTK
jgi:hypothetical protein